MSNLTTTIKLLLIFLLIGLFCTVPTGIAAYLSARISIQEKTFNSLSSLRSEKKKQIENYFSNIRKQIQNFASDLTIINASKAFNHAYNNYHETNSEALLDIKKQLLQHYDKEFIGKLKRNKNITADTEDYINHLSDTSTRLQNSYIVHNPNPTGSKQNLDRVPEKNEYNDTHQLYHPIIKKYLDTFGFYDIFLVDAETGTIVYTVFKEVDFGSNLYNGMYKDTNIAKAFKAAQSSNEHDYTKLVDFESYDPSYGAPASFISAPIFDGDKKIGILIFQLPIDQINSVMTSNEKWIDVGLGKTGESYLVGQDRTMRSVSRFIVENPFEFFLDLKQLGINSALIERMKQLSTTILMLDIQTESVIKALQGYSGIMKFKDYRGVEVLSTYSPVDIKDVNWAIITEMDLDEAFEPVYALTKTSIIVGCSSLALLILISLLLARSVTKPSRKINELFNTILKNQQIDLKSRIPVKNKDIKSDISNKINTTIDLWQYLVEKINNHSDKIDELASKINQWNSKNNQKIQHLLSHTKLIRNSVIEAAHFNEQTFKLIERYEALTNRQTEFLRVSDVSNTELSFVEDKIKEQAHNYPHQIITKFDSSLYAIEKCLINLKSLEQKYPDISSQGYFSEAQNSLKNSTQSLEDSRSALLAADLSSFINEVGNKIQSFIVKTKLENLNLQNLTKQHVKLITELQDSIYHEKNTIITINNYISDTEISISREEKEIEFVLSSLNETVQQIKQLTKNYVW